MVREARFQDIPRLCELMTEAHGKSKYKDYRLDLKNRFKPLVKNSILSGNGCVLVSETDGEIEGFLIGTIDDLYHVLAVKYATDLLFWVSDRDDPRNFVRLAQAFREWARQPNVVRIRLGVTDLVGDTEPVEKLYEKTGFRREGAMFEMEIGK